MYSTLLVSIDPKSISSNRIVFVLKCNQLSSISVEANSQKSLDVNLVLSTYIFRILAQNFNASRYSPAFAIFY